MNPFQVITSEEQLQASTHGVSKSRFQQVAASREVGGPAFSGKQISYKFSTSANQWFAPKESYLRARCTLSKSNGTQLTLSDDVAARSGLLANLFQSMEVRVNGTVVSRCTDNVAQVDALLHRSTKSKSWLESIGAAINFYGDDSDKRKADVSADGILKRLPLRQAIGGDYADDASSIAYANSATAVNSRRVREFELTWDMAPLSLFRSENNLPPGCDIELVLNPYGGSQYKNNAIDSSTAKIAGVGVGKDFDFTVESMVLYAKIYEGSSYDNGTAILDLTDVNCHTEVGPFLNFAQKTFDVSPSTHMLTVAFQDERQVDSSHSASEFVCNKPDPKELKLQRLFISYDGQQHPQPDADPDFTATADRTTQRYLETQQAIGAYQSESGGESLHDWQKRGAYYSFKWDRDGRSAATRAVVYSQFSANLDQSRMLLFDHAYSNCKLEFVNGRCVTVIVESA